MEQSMKILIVGGCGMQARPAIERLIDGDVFSKIVIGDINHQLAAQLVKELHSPKVSARSVDAFDHTGMVQAMSEVDVVMNCSGPYHLLGVRVLKAAIEAGKHFVDYCDDVEPTLEMLKLSDQAKAKGITAIIGLGVSPGYFNLLAKDASNRLDTTREINMYWSIAQGEPEGPAVIDHMLDIMSGEVIQFIDGKEVRVPALSGTEQEVDMPEPFGRMPAAFVGHPEPVTLSRYIPGVQQVINKYAAPLEEIGLFQGLQELGLMRKEPICVRNQQVSPRDVLVTLMSSVPHEDTAGESNKSAAVLEVKGTLDGIDQLIRYSLTGNMAPLTSLPAAIGAELLARGQITETGVLPPEACVPPQAVLQPLADSGLVEINEEIITSECSELSAA
jgi:saccharopine dehydrogenase (NAD+, L-lysine-forming)